MTAAQDFLTAIFSPYSEGYVELRAIGGEKPFICTHPLDELPQLVKNAHILDSTQQYPTITIGALPRTREFGAGRAGRREDVVSEAATLWLDVDGLFAEPPTDEQLTAALEPILVALPEGFTPRACVCSGHGIHLYFTLTEPIPTPTIEKLNRALVEHLKKQGIEGADSQSTDAARVMRLPDTVNRKGEPSIPCTVIQLNSDAKLSTEKALSLIPPETSARRESRDPPAQGLTALSKINLEALTEAIKPYWVA
ncbi:MAG: hypothetical protein ACXQS4_03840, partial [Methermicoccaceae archaeon]